MNGKYIGKILYSLLNSTVNVSPAIAPQAKTLPYCVYDILSVETDNVKDGGSLADCFTILLSVYATTYSQANTLADAVRYILDHFTGVTGGCWVDGLWYVTESDDYDRDEKAYIKTLEFKIRTLNT